MEVSEQLVLCDMLPGPLRLPLMLLKPRDCPAGQGLSHVSDIRTGSRHVVGVLEYLSAEQPTNEYQLPPFYVLAFLMCHALS